MFKKLSLSIAILLAAASAFAQNIAVSGCVTGPENGPEPGVMVYLKSNNTIGAMTDDQGRYSIEVPSNGVLVFSSLGLKTLEENVAGRKVINVTLESDANLLDEVVVLGYGTQKKEFVVGSVSQVTDKDLLKAPTTNVQSMLTGRLSGFTNIQTSGTPGAESSTMLVRGYSTFNNSSPLIIVDGVERPITYLNPNDIASVSVLKDAATAAIYGVRGANGVVLVTTKSGARGSAKIVYDGSATFTNNICMPELCNAEQYIKYYNKACEMDGQDPLWTEENLNYMKQNGLYGETNYLDLIYNNFGFAHQHNISASGGNDKVRYFTSIGLMDQDGILKNTEYNRYNIRSNVEAKLAEGLDFSLNIAGDYSTRHMPGYSFSTGADDQGSTAPAEFSPITQAFYAIPILKPTIDAEAAAATGYTEGTALGFQWGNYCHTPVAALMNSGYQDQSRYSLETTSKLEYSFGDNLFKGLRLSMFAAFNFDFTADRALMTPFNLVALNSTMTLTPGVSQGITIRNFTKSASFGRNLTLRPQIDYARTFGEHSISFIGLFERYKYYGDTMTSYAQGYFADEPVDVSLGMTSIANSPSGSFNQSGFASFAGQLNYAFRDRYLLAATLRRDGTYKFSSDYRWGTFPSIALGWVMSKEDFFTPLADKVDFFKLRASYGELGSDDTDPYLYMQLFNTWTNSAVIGGEAQTSFVSSGYVYENLTWSHTKSFNVGFETRMFKNKLTAEFDWFYKLTDRILEYDSTGTYAPSLGGYNPVWMNTGRMDNRGFELTLRHDNWFANGFSYSVTGLLSWSHNRVLNRRITDDHPSYRQILGQPVGQTYGFHCLGLFQTQEQLDDYPSAPSGEKLLGCLMYEDVNGDGRIDINGDYVKIARSSVPELTGSINCELNYKNFSLFVLFQGAAISDYLLSGAYNNVIDNTIFTRPFYGSGNSVLYLCEDAWTDENTDGKWPRLSTKNLNNNGFASDYWVVNGAYLRIKNVQFCYTLPQAWSRALDMDTVRLSLAGTNLFTLSHFKYLDPENPGINNGYYPQQRTVSLGLNVTF